MNRQLVFVSLTSISLACYLIIKKYLCSKKVTSLSQSKIYEEKALLDQYMLFNFSEPEEILLFDLKEYSNITKCFQFPKRVALICRDYCPDLFFSDQVSINLFNQNNINANIYTKTKKTKPRNALDVGCAVGRSCFELSKLFDSVIGIDYSVNFIDHCNKFINDKYIEYECTLEGNLNQKLSVRIDPDVVSLIYLYFLVYVFM